MRRIDKVKNKKMKNIQFAQVLDHRRVKVVFNNNHYIILKACIEGYDDTAMYIAEESKI